MKRNGLKLGATRFLPAAAAAVLAGSISIGFAQSPKPSPSARDTSAAVRARDRDLSERSANLDRIGKDQTAPSEVVLKIKDDFRRMQIVNNELIRDVKYSLRFDYRHIADSAEEINKCARRLKGRIPMLATEGSAKKQKTESPRDDIDLKASLSRLDQAITNFVTNMALVDATNAGKAADDLASVIHLSESVRKSAERLAKLEHSQ